MVLDSCSSLATESRSTPLKSNRDLFAMFGVHVLQIQGVFSASKPFVGVLTPSFSMTADFLKPKCRQRTGLDFPFQQPVPSLLLKAAA